MCPFRDLPVNRIVPEAANSPSYDHFKSEHWALYSFKSVPQLWPPSNAKENPPRDPENKQVNIRVPKP